MIIWVYEQKPDWILEMQKPFLRHIVLIRFFAPTFMCNGRSQRGLHKSDSTIILHMLA